MFYLSNDHSNVPENFFAVFRGWLILLSIILAAFVARLWAHKDKDHSAQAQHHRQWQTWRRLPPHGQKAHMA